MLKSTMFSHLPIILAMQIHSRAAPRADSLRETPHITNEIPPQRNEGRPTGRPQKLETGNRKLKPTPSSAASPPHARSHPRCDTQSRSSLCLFDRGSARAIPASSPDPTAPPAHSDLPSARLHYSLSSSP